MELQILLNVRRKTCAAVEAAVQNHSLNNTKKTFLL